MDIKSWWTINFFAVTKYANARDCLMAVLLVHISHLSLVILARFTHFFFFPNEGLKKKKSHSLSSHTGNREGSSWVDYSTNIILYAKHSRRDATTWKTDTVPILIGHIVYSSAVQ